MSTVHTTTSTRPQVFFVGRSGGRFIDNAKYAFVHAATHDYGFDPIFLTSYRDVCVMLRTAGLPVMLTTQCSPATLLQGAMVVADDFLGSIGPAGHVLREIPCLQLWHGLPIKKIGFAEIESGINMNPQKAAHLALEYSGYRAVASTSAWATEHCFNNVFKTETFLNFGYPRNDPLLAAATKFSLLNVDTDLYSRMLRHKKSGGKTLFYMPTFRDTGGDFLSDKTVDLVALSQLCTQHNILFVAKFHPYFRVDRSDGLENFIMCKSSTDAYPLLPFADALITDYSSIYYDYLLLDRPVIFYAYDLEKYTTCDRDLFFDYADIAHGAITQTQSELFTAILNLVTHGADPQAAPRRELAARVHVQQDALAAHRYCQWIADSVTPNSL